MSNRLRMMRFAAAAAVAVSWGPIVAVGAGPELKPPPRGMAGPAAVDKTKSGMVDIALDDHRTLRGRFVDSSGAPIDGAVVTLKQSDRVIARSTTLADGSFKINQVSSGAYRLTCGSATGQIRCWAPGAAPPNAVIDGVTFQDSVVRGQAGAVAPALFGSTTAVTTAAASATAIGGVAAYTAADQGTKIYSTSPTGTTSIAPDSQLPSYRPGQSIGQESRIRYDDGRWADYHPGGKLIPPPDVVLPPDLDTTGPVSP